VSNNFVPGRDVIAVPMAYFSEFVRDPVDALLKFGSQAQRARSPWYTMPERIREACSLPSLVAGELAVPRYDSHGGTWMAAEAHPDEDRLLGALAGETDRHRSDWRGAPWHVHVDPGLHRGRKGDAAGLAVGRILDEVHVPQHGGGIRVVRR